MARLKKTYRLEDEAANATACAARNRAAYLQRTQGLASRNVEFVMYELVQEGIPAPTSATAGLRTDLSIP